MASFRLRNVCEGFGKRGLRRAGGRNDRCTRRIAFEPLEDRRLLSVTAELITDINALEAIGARPGPFIESNGTIFFGADDGIIGRELWKTDGTESGTVLLKDVRSGAAGSGPGGFADVNGTLFFTADDGVNGVELWKSDGTATGTILVKDIFPGSGAGSPAYLTNVDGTLFFTASDGVNGRELWKSDGTAAGTVMVKDIRPGSASSVIQQLTNLNGTLFFTADDGSNGRELWRSDGTTPGTFVFHDILPGSAGANPQSLTNANGTLFFVANNGTHGRELWRTDGGTAGTFLVKDIAAGTATAYPQALTNINGALFFSAFDGVNGAELWKSDGTSSGTVLVKDIFPGSGSSGPRYMVNVNGHVFFEANDGTHGRELWKSDGTAAGTFLVKDIFPGSQGANPNTLRNVDGTVLFRASDGTHGMELWRSDGTATGTVLVKDIRPGIENGGIYSVARVNGALFFSADDSVHGSEIWRSDGTAAGTQLLKNINLTTQGSFPHNFIDLNGTTVFSARDATNGQELWTTDGTSAGTILLKDIFPGIGSAQPFSLTLFNGTLYFTADDGTNGRELWKSDGTTEGTVMVKDIFTGTVTDQYGVIRPASGYPFDLTVFNGALFFSAVDGVNGRELWTSDGTAAGTVLVKDILEGTETDAYGVVRPSSSFPGSLTEANGMLFFTAREGNDNSELWKTDGTAAGTVRIKDINPGSGHANPQDLTNVNGTLFFSANDGTNGVELWKSDGTAAGTALVHDILPGIGSSSPRNLTNVDGTLFFSSGGGLWKSDGTSAGTVSVLGGIGPLHLTNVNGTLFFTANDGINGQELWKSDGTTFGTVLVKDIFAGSGSANPQSTNAGSQYSRLTSIDGILFFGATDGANGRELWKSDGTASGTVLVHDIVPGSGSAYLNSLTNISGTLFFSADDGINGSELWRLFDPPIEVPVNTATINDDLQAVVSDIQSTTTGSGAAPPEVLLSATDTELDAVVAAVEALAPSANTAVVTIVVNLADGDYDGQTITVPEGVRLVIVGTTSSVTFEGASPAFTIVSGEVVVRGVTFVNSTDAPTILVTGGSLIVRDSILVETTGGSHAAIEVLGGKVDLGTAADLGGNVLNISGPGELIRNASGSAIPAIGNTFQVDGAPFASNFRIEDKIYHGLDAAGVGIVTFVAGNAFVTPASGSIQRGVDGVTAEGMVNVEGTLYADYIAGAKPLTVQFTTGQRFSQEVDAVAGGVRSVFVTGTAAAEDIQIDQGLNSGEVDAAMSGVPTATFAPQGRIVVFAGGGNDNVQVAGSIALPAWLYGGAGNDRLKGGAGHDLLFGEDGDDLLVGGSGRDLLIGGMGADRIVGNADDDILIAAFTAFDHDQVALSGIMAEWTSARNYATRTANISGTGSGSSFDARQNANYFLTTQTTQPTVFDDAAKDVLTGSSGQDWFFANLESGVLDKVTDLSADEFQPDLEFILSE